MDPEIKTALITALASLNLLLAALTIHFRKRASSSSPDSLRLRREADRRLQRAEEQLSRIGTRMDILEAQQRVESEQLRRIEQRQQSQGETLAELKGTVENGMEGIEGTLETILGRLLSGGAR